MGLETGTYLDDLVATNPVNATDSVSEGDDHIRLIKSVLLATFPNLMGAMTASEAELNVLDGFTGNAADVEAIVGLAIEFALLAGLTASAAELNVLDGFTGSAANIETLSGITAAAASIFNDATVADILTTLGVTAAAQTVLDDASVPAMQTTLGIGIGDYSFFIPAAGLLPRTTAGPAWGGEELVTNDIMTNGLDYASSSSEYAQATFGMQKGWDEGTLTVRFYWTAGSGSGDVVWKASLLSLGDNDAIDAALGTGQTVTDTFLTADDMHISSWSSAITAAGSPAEDDMMVLVIERDGGNVSDTFTVDARLLGVQVKFTRNASDDS